MPSSSATQCCMGFKNTSYIKNKYLTWGGGGGGLNYKINMIYTDMVFVCWSINLTDYIREDGVI